MQKVPRKCYENHGKSSEIPQKVLTLSSEIPLESPYKVLRKYTESPQKACRTFLDILGQLDTFRDNYGCFVMFLGALRFFGLFLDVFFLCFR